MLGNLKLDNALKLYRQVVTPALVEATLESTAIAYEQRGGIFSTAVVVWLMIFQRLSGDHTLARAIEHLKTAGVRELLISSEAGSIKARHGRISSATGGYSHGRQRVPLSVVESITDTLNKEISKANLHDKKEKSEAEKVYSIDGTTILISHSEENVKEYSQHKTRLGVSHYPLMRVTIATDVTSGVATRPVIGAHNGSKATSEVAQSHEILLKLERGSLVLADRFYGVTQVVHTTQRAGLNIIVRLKDSVANRLIGSSDKEGDRKVLWRPSEYEQTRYEHLEGAEIPGRYICKTIHRDGFPPIKLRLFTTCDKPTAEVVRLYGLRWNIEQDLRQLKTTLELNFINAKTPEMVAKEIITGVTAYNLIRHFMKVAAIQLDTTVRSLSFTGALRRMTTLGELSFKHSSATNEAGISDSDLLTFLGDLKIMKLPVRKKPRPSQPREKWRQGAQNYRRSVGKITVNSEES